MTMKAKYKEEDELLSISLLLPQTSSTGNIIPHPSQKGLRL
jgi:hypothetical protein